MTAAKYHSSRPDAWTYPRPRIAALTQHIHGPLRGMEEPRRSWIMRFVGRGM